MRSPGRSQAEKRKKRPRIFLSCPMPGLGDGAHWGAAASRSLGLHLHWLASLVLFKYFLPDTLSLAAIHLLPGPELASQHIFQTILFLIICN